MSVGTAWIWVSAAVLVVVLALTRLRGAPEPLTLVLQVAFFAMVVALVVLDYRSAVGLAMTELAIAGASGSWTVLPGGISGRICLLAIVLAGGIAWIAVRYRQTGRLELGRYAPHAVAVAVVMPLVWIPLGVANGSSLRDAILDGNGYAFLAFTLAFVAVMQRGDSIWIRRWLLVACLANAVFTGFLIVLALTGIAPLTPAIKHVLTGPNSLDFGGIVAYMPTGAGRLFLASGLYLQIGLVLVVWQLIAERSSRLWWLAYALLLVDIAATYTRGFWVAAAIALVGVMVLGAKDWRRPAAVVAATGVTLLVATVAGWMIGGSVPDYLMQRAGSVLTTRPIDVSGEPGSPIVIDIEPDAGIDVVGQVSNQMRVIQARVLVGHIQERPLIGSGFGSIAADYTLGRTFVYELTYLDILFKTGLVGAVIFLSYPLRLLLDSVLGRMGRIRLPRGVSRRQAAVPLACIASVLIATASNPYLLAAYGLMPIIAMIAWLDPVGEDPGS